MFVTNRVTPMFRNYYRLPFVKKEEEFLCQWMINELIETYGYPLKDIQQGWNGESDNSKIFMEVAVFPPKGRNDQPMLVTKLKEYNFQDVLELQEIFMAFPYLRYLVLTDGYGFEIFTSQEVEGKLQIKRSRDIPTYQEILETMEEIEVPLSKHKNVPILEVDPFLGSKNSFIIPVLHYTAAGTVRDSQEMEHGEIYLPKDCGISEKSIAVLVKGDSMVDVGIYDGDVVLVKPKNVPNKGEIGIFVVEEDYSFGALCKKIFPISKGYQLVSQNAKKQYEDILVSQNGRYIGEVIGVYKEV